MSNENLRIDLAKLLASSFHPIIHRLAVTQMWANERDTGFQEALAVLRKTKP